MTTSRIRQGVKPFAPNIVSGYCHESVKVMYGMGRAKANGVPSRGKVVAIARDVPRWEIGGVRGRTMAGIRAETRAE